MTYQAIQSFSATQRPDISRIVQHPSPDRTWIFPDSECKVNQIFSNKEIFQQFLHIKITFVQSSSSVAAISRSPRSRGSS